MHRPFAVVFLMLVSVFPAGTAAQSQGARAGPFLKEPAFAELDRQLADPAHLADAARLSTLGREREQAARLLEQAELAWLELL